MSAFALEIILKILFLVAEKKLEYMCHLTSKLQKLKRNLEYLSHQ